MTDIVPEHIRELHDWLRRRQFQYFHINSTPRVRAVEAACRKCRWLGVARRQFFRLSPLNFRSLFPAAWFAGDPQSAIILARAYLLLSDHYRIPQFFDAFQACGNQVLDYRSPTTRHFAIRVNQELFLKRYEMTATEPSPLLTALAGELFLDSWQVLGREEYAALSADTVAYFAEDHPRDERPEGVYFYYEPKQAFRVYNASAAISAFLLKAGSLLHDARAWELGRRGIEFVCSRQNPDGSWFYGEAASARYVDGFHSAFVLEALHEARRYLDSEVLARHLETGMEYYQQNLFRRQAGGRLEPRHFAGDAWPTNSSGFLRVDLRDCALAIILFSKCAARDRASLQQAAALLDWANRHMRTTSTYCPEITWLWKNRIPYIDFQAWMLLALACYERTSAEKEPTDAAGKRR